MMIKYVIFFIMVLIFIYLIKKIVEVGFNG